MTRFTKWLFALSLLVAGPLGLAQENTLPTPPAEPVIKRAPEHAAWTVVYTPKQAASDTSKPVSTTGKTSLRVLKQVNVLKAGDTFQEIKEWSDGATTQKWIYQGNMLFETPGSSQICFMSAQQNRDQPFGHDYSKADFDELDWVSLANFKDVTTYQGHLCYHFQNVVPGGTSSANSTADAWIDGKTGLPVGASDGQVTKAFTFRETGPQKLELPGPFAAAFQSYLKIVNSTQVVPR